MMWLKLIKDISRYDFVVPGMKTSGETFKQHYFSELVFQSSWEITFSFAFHLNSVLFTIIFSHLMISLTYERKPSVTVNLLLWLFFLPFIWFLLISIFMQRKNEIACKSPSISMLILILSFQSRTEKLTMTATCLLYLILICFTFCFFIFFLASVGYVTSYSLPAIIFKFLF